MKVILESKKDYWMLRKLKPAKKDKDFVACMIYDALASMEGMIHHGTNKNKIRTSESL